VGKTTLIFLRRGNDPLGMFSMNMIYKNEQKNKKLKTEKEKEKAQKDVVEQISIQEADTEIPKPEKPARKKKGEK